MPGCSGRSNSNSLEINFMLQTSRRPLFSSDERNSLNSTHPVVRIRLGTGFKRSKDQASCMPHNEALAQTAWSAEEHTALWQALQAI